MNRRDAVVEAAVTWWRWHRPVGWSLDQHLTTPDINCSRHGEGARQLARAVAAFVEARGQRRRKTLRPGEVQ